jgi:rhomboid protease GluP
MEPRLTRTFLSKRPTTWSFMAGLLGLSTLALFFGADRELLSANGNLVFEEHEYWRLFTTTLLHADLVHFSHNAFFFAGLAGLLWTYFGVWVFPVLSLVAGALINLVALWWYPPEVHLVGVSGVIYFMASFWLTNYVLIERRQRPVVRLLHAGAVSLIFLFPQVFEREVSYLAHGLGFAFGVPAGLAYYFTFRATIRAYDEYELPAAPRDDGADYDDGDDFYDDGFEEVFSESPLLDPTTYHPERPEGAGPSRPASDSVRSRRR